MTYTYAQQLTVQIGFEDGENGWPCLPFEGWSTNEDIFLYLRGYYLGKKFRQTL